MYTLDHSNVLTLSGVCLDGGTAPYIIMPFMSNGSLLAYLKNNRRTLVASQEAEIDDEEVSTLILTLAFNLSYFGY
jgi:serine/threonine protein kinase